MHGIKYAEPLLHNSVPFTSSSYMEIGNDMQKHTLTLVAAGLLFSSAALAGGLSFTELDSDGDGTISKAEAAGSATLAPLFGEADSNGDGKLDKDEFAALVQPAEESAPAK